ncbi:MAG: GNAT family N-acetyltransferase [Acidobacteriota bacterium]
MTAFKALRCCDLNEEVVARFFRKAFTNRKKAQFLIDHGGWWHREGKDRYLVAGPTGEPVGHFALIDTRVLLGGAPHDASWAIDLILLPEYRGRGIQTLLDSKIRSVGKLCLAFPNEIAGKIHRRHNWRGRREGFHLTFPFTLMALPRFRFSRGLKGRLARFLARGSFPLSGLLRWYLSRYRPSTARRLKSPDPEVLSEVFFRHNLSNDLITTFRDADFFRWRYLQSPHYLEYTFYIVGPQTDPNLALITRLTHIHGVKTMRIVDIFGALEHESELRDILRLALRDSALHRVEQVVAMATVPRLIARLRAEGFILREGLDLCWYSENQAQMLAVEQSHHHWTLADSDKDPP